MDAKPLIADVLIGIDITNCLVLASHPDERMTADGHDPSLTRRTIVMRFNGRSFSEATSVPVPLHRGWSSSGGAGYCTAIRGSHCYVHDGGQWRREQFSDEDEDVMRIGGLSGGDPRSDVVFISTDGALHMRRDAAWTRYVPPEPAQRVFGVHGPNPDELYVCTDNGLLMWTPKGGFQQPADHPRPIVKEILVTGGEIYAGDRYLMHWAPQAGWQRLQPTVPDVTAIVEVGRVVIVGTFEKGVWERQGTTFAAATPEFECLDLQRVGSGVFAAADDGGYVRVAAQWHKLVLPSCLPGQLPPGPG